MPLHRHHRPQPWRARRRAAASTAAALAVGVALAAGCASSPGGGAPKQVIAAAPDKTIAAGVAAITIDRFGLHAEGVLDLAHDAVRVTVTDSGAGGVPAEVLAVGPRVWTRPTPGRGPWTESDPAAAGLLSLPGGLRSGDPRAAVDLVRGAARIVVFGGLQVQQTSTVRYDVYSDPVAAAAASPADDAQRLTQLAAQVSHTVRVDVYVDGEGRIRRLELPEDLISATPATRPDQNRISATIDLVRFGVDPGDLSAPAAAG